MPAEERRAGAEKSLPMRQMRGRGARAGEQRDRLGRFLALVLRHRPESIGIALDPSGFVDLEVLAKAIAGHPGWAWVSEDVIRAAAERDARRYEIDGTRIRARYGHSVPIDAPGPPVVPPEWLYHGTSPESLVGVQREGLTPQGRQFVHLSATRQDALAVGKRHSSNPVVVTVLARRAHEAGVKFYQASAAIYLAREIVPDFLLVPPQT